MFVNTSRFLFALLITTSSIANAANGNDLVIFDDVPHALKQKLFTEVVDQAILGKTHPDRYHVTLMWVEDIKQNLAHFNMLKGRLDAIRDQHLPNAHFTPTEAKQLVPSKTGTIVLVPTADEEAQFKQVHHFLYNEVINFNLQHNTAYKFERHMGPKNYNPHMTLANTTFIKKNALNPVNIVQNVNLNLENYKQKNGVQMDLLQVNQPVAPAPVLPPVVAPVVPVHQPVAPVVVQQPVASVVVKQPVAPMVVAQPVSPVSVQPQVTPQVAPQVVSKATAVKGKKAVAKKVRKTKPVKAKKVKPVRAKRAKTVKAKKTKTLKIKRTKQVRAKKIKPVRAKKSKAVKTPRAKTVTKRGKK